MTAKEVQEKIKNKKQNNISLESRIAELKDLLKSINNSIINGNLMLAQTINNGNNQICQMINNLPNQITSQISSQIASQISFQNEIILTAITNGNNQILDALKMKEHSNNSLKKLSPIPSDENSEQNKNTTVPKKNKNITKENNSSSNNGNKKKHTSLIKIKKFDKMSKTFIGGNLNLTNTNCKPAIKKGKINTTASIPRNKRNNIRGKN